LTAEERARFLKTLDTDDEALELLAETLQNTRGLEEPVYLDVPLRSSSATDELGSRALGITFGRWLAAAAAILLAFVMIFAWQRERTTLPVAVLLEPISGDARLRMTGVDSRLWSASRGAGDVAGFRLGVELVDLHLASSTNDSALRQSILSRMQALVESEGMGSDLHPSRRPEVFERRLESELDPAHLAYGKWAESARIAAANDSSDFFSSVQFRDFIHEIRRLNMTGYVRTQIDRAEVMLEQRIGPDELRELETLFTSIVNLNGGL
jgi:hypothetical protein